MRFFLIIYLKQFYLLMFHLNEYLKKLIYLCLLLVELIEYKYLSFDNKLEKSLNNFLGIYNTKREKSQKIFDYKDNRTKIKNRIKNFDRKKLFFYEGLNEKFIKKPRVMSAYTPSVKNKMRKNKNEEFMSLIKFLDKSKRNEIYKN